MNYYKVIVHVTNREGEKIKYETQHNFVSDRDAYIYASGFAKGCAEVNKGLVLDKQIEALNDDSSQQ